MQKNTKNWLKAKQTFSISPLFYFNKILIIMLEFTDNFKNGKAFEELHPFLKDACNIKKHLSYPGYMSTLPIYSNSILR